MNNNFIKVKKSNLFSNINKKFDLISFNPPYVPFSNLKQEKIKYKHIRYSSSNGTQVAENFLKGAKKYLTTSFVFVFVFRNKKQIFLLKQKKQKFCYCFIWCNRTWAKISQNKGEKDQA